MKLKFLKSEFFKKAFTLISGNSVAQLITVIVAPIITRLYSPSDLGVFTLFLSTTQLLSVISCGAFEYAITTAKYKREALNIIILSILLTFSLNLILFAILIVISPIINHSGFQNIYWIYYVPLGAFMMSLYNIFNYSNLRVVNYKKIAFSNVIKSSARALADVISGIAKFGYAGLVASIITSFLIGSYLLSGSGKLRIKTLFKIGRSSFKKTFKSNSYYPKFYLPGLSLNNISLHLPNYFISSLYGSTILGYYSYSFRVLSMPLTLVGKSLADTFFEIGSKRNNSGQSLLNLYDQTLFKMMLFAIPAFTVAYLFIEEIFSFVFGAEWHIAGVYCKIILPLLCIRLIARPLTMIFLVLQQQKVLLVWQALLLLFTVVVFAVSYFNKFTVIYYLQLFTITLSSLYVAIILIGRYICSKN